jgi:Family of unknown function (DUF6444)
VPDLALDEQLAAENAVLRAENAGLRAENAVLRAEHEEREGMLATLTQRVAELERRWVGDSSNSSRPPSSDAPWSKKPATKRSSRSRSGRKPGKQPGASSSSRSLLVTTPRTRWRSSRSAAGAVMPRWRGPRSAGVSGVRLSMCGRRRRRRSPSNSGS